MRAIAAIMPPKTIDIKTLIAKRDNSLSALYELLEEFKLVIEIDAESRVDLIKNIYSQNIFISDTECTQ